MDFKDKRLMMSKEEVINRAKELLNENQEVLIAKYMFLEQQCKKQKEVIEEIRKKLKLERKTALSLNQAYTVSVIDSVLQILDKGESNE